MGKTDIIMPPFVVEGLAIKLADKLLEIDERLVE